MVDQIISPLIYDQKFVSKRSSSSSHIPSESLIVPFFFSHKLLVTKERGFGIKLFFIRFVAFTLYDESINLLVKRTIYIYIYSKIV